MNEKTKDSDKGAEDQRFSPTDWDWAMLLSGEINAIETRSDTLGNMFIGAVSVVAVFMIAAWSIGNSYIINSKDPNIIFIVFLVFVIVCYFVFICHANLALRERRREDAKRVKLLKECRDELFDRLDDPNKTVERCFKKGDENK